MSGWWSNQRFNEHVMPSEMLSVLNMKASWQSLESRGSFITSEYQQVRNNCGPCEVAKTVKIDMKCNNNRPWQTAAIETILLLKPFLQI